MAQLSNTHRDKKGSPYKGGKKITVELLKWRKGATPGNLGWNQSGGDKKGMPELCYKAVECEGGHIEAYF